MSLPLVIGLLNQPGQVGPDAIRAVLAQVRSSIAYCNDMMEKQDMEDEDF
jgi:fructoselysine and glucoselysine-specific PTS system IIA component